MTKELFFIVNPASAGGKTGSVWRHIRSLLQNDGADFDSILTNVRGEATQIAAAAVKEGHTKVIAVGGDGTLNEVVNGIFEGKRIFGKEPCLGYFPSGTGEDFARSLGIERLSVQTQLQRILNAVPAPIDVGEVNFQCGDGSKQTRRFINESSVGFGANVAELVNRSKKLLGGKASFFAGVLRSLCFLKNHAVRIKADGKDLFEGRTLITTVSNGKYFGGSMMIAPKAIIDDGYFDVIVAKEMNRREIMRDIGTIYSGNHLSNPKIISARCKTLSVQSEEKVFLEMDGEPVGLIDAEFRIHEKEIKFLL